MDGTRKYAWLSALPQGSPDIFLRAAGAELTTETQRTQRRQKAEKRKREEITASKPGNQQQFFSSSLPFVFSVSSVSLWLNFFLVDRINQHPQAAEAAAVEAEPQPRQVGHVRV